MNGNKEYDSLRPLEKKEIYIILSGFFLRLSKNPKEKPGVLEKFCITSLRGLLQGIEARERKSTEEEINQKDNEEFLEILDLIIITESAEKGPKEEYYIEKYDRKRCLERIQDLKRLIVKIFDESEYTFTKKEFDYIHALSRMYTLL